MTTNQHHVVLGGNGTAGRETVRALLRRGERVTSVGRRSRSPEDGAVSAQADLLNPADVDRVLADADVAYITVGLPYSHRVWAQQWPVIIRNVVDAATAHGTHVVHLDNVYALGAVDGLMTEQSPIRPSSKKGRVRANAIEILDAARERGLAVATARSADFYGPGATTSAFNTFVIDPVAAGRSGTWLFDAHQPHSLTYSPDIGTAMAVLGTDPAAVGRVWHVPTAAALTGAQWLELAGGAGAPAKVMGRATMRIGALFNRSARETLEIAYQYERPYLFDSSAFESAFGITATPPEAGVRASLEAALNRRRAGSHQRRGTASSIPRSSS
jgi:nucleoside-diphosphate-sugar epimerase